MPIDSNLAASLAGFVHPGGRIAERFLRFEIEGSLTTGVLSTPQHRKHPLGWVVCHAFGMEQLYLQPLEVAVSRALAGAGFPVLRYHSRGYGDSDFPTEDLSVDISLQDAIVASFALRDAADVPEVGFLGARFGGTIAALAADQLQARALTLWEPVLDGARYLQSMVRLAVATELASRGRAAGSAREPDDILRELGVLDLQGFPVGPRLFEEVSAVRLVSSLRRFRGASLVVNVSRAAGSQPPRQPLVDHLQRLGGECTLEFVSDPDAPMFGQQRYRLNAAGHKTDRQGALSAALVDLTVAWASRLEQEPAAYPAGRVP